MLLNLNNGLASRNAIILSIFCYFLPSYYSDTNTCFYVKISYNFAICHDATDLCVKVVFYAKIYSSLPVFSNSK